MVDNTTAARKILYTLMGHMSIGSCYLISNYGLEVSVRTFKKKGLTSERPDFGKRVPVHRPPLNRPLV